MTVGAGSSAWSRSRVSTARWPSVAPTAAGSPSRSSTRGSSATIRRSAASSSGACASSRARRIPSSSTTPTAIDVVGHGTACAGIIHGLAPGADIISVRVLGPDNRGKGTIFAAGLEWAIANGASVVNLSLSSKSEALFAGLPRDRRRGLLRQRAPRQRREQRPGSELSVAVLVGRVGRRPRRRRPLDLVLQPVATGRVRGVRGRRRRRLEGRLADRRDRQQLRGAARRRVSPRSSGRSTRTRPRSRSRRSWRPSRTRRDRAVEPDRSSSHSPREEGPFSIP